MADLDSSKTRYRVRLNTGIVVAEGLYRFQTTRLIDPSDGHSRIPRGAFVFCCDMDQFAGCDDGDIWLSCFDVCRDYQGRIGHLDFTSESPIDAYGSGCCGLSGDLKDVATDEVIGKVFTDCYNSHYVKLNAEHFELEPEESSQAVTLVGLVDFEESQWVVGWAMGRDTSEAEERLFELSEKNIITESAYAYHCGLSLEALQVYAQPADRFLHDLGDKPISWLFLKNRPTSKDVPAIAFYKGGRSWGPPDESPEERESLEAALLAELNYLQTNGGGQSMKKE